MSNRSQKNIPHVILATVICSFSSAYSVAEVYGESAHNETPAPVSCEKQDYDNTFDLMKDFLDLNVKPETDMKYWVRQFMGLIKNKNKAEREKLDPFVREFNTALRSQQPVLIGLAFKNHKEKFNEPALTEYMKKQLNQPDGLAKLNNALKARLLTKKN